MRALVFTNGFAATLTLADRPIAFLAACVGVGLLTGLTPSRR